MADTPHARVDQGLCCYALNERCALITSVASTFIISVIYSPGLKPRVTDITSFQDSCKNPLHELIMNKTQHTNAMQP